MKKFENIGRAISFLFGRKRKLPEDHDGYLLVEVPGYVIIKASEAYHSEVWEQVRDGRYIALKTGDPRNVISGWRVPMPASFPELVRLGIVDSDEIL